MMEYKIVTDSTADLPESFYRENQIGCMFVPFILNGTEYSEDHQMELKEFYRLMREEKAMPTTSQINPEQALNYFRKWLKESKKILCLSFSSGLSGLYNSVELAAGLAMEEDPEAEIIVIDSLCAELGEGLFVYVAVQLKKQGMDLKEAAEWLKEHRTNFIHVFNADSLFHLYRGGRVSKTAAFVGTIMSIKPIMHVDDEGHLIPVSKAHGKKKSLNMLVDMMEESIQDYAPPYDMVMIGHSDCEEDAFYIRDEIKRRFGRENFVINFMGPTIGAHIGPGACALYFLGKHR